MRQQLQIYMTMKVKIKVLSSLFLLLIYVVSCSDQQSTAQDQDESSSNSAVVNSDEQDENTTVDSEYDVYFTDQLVSKVCDCKTNSVSESGGMDVQKMRDCMGGTMIDVVKEKLGENATEIQIEEARKIFVDKINKKCS